MHVCRQETTNAVTHAVEAVVMPNSTQNDRDEVGLEYFVASTN